MDLQILIGMELDALKIVRALLDILGSVMIFWINSFLAQLKLSI